MRRIGLTGSIASGKSTASARLRALGALVLDADEIARAVVAPGTEGLRRVLAAFEGVAAKDGSLDRRALARIVFSDAAQREKLNAILHPLIFAELERQAEQSGEEIVVFDIPLLFECGMQASMDEVWLVYAPLETRIARIMARDGATREQALARINAQMQDEEKLAIARGEKFHGNGGAGSAAGQAKRPEYRILYNGGDIAALYERVDEYWGSVLKRQ